MEELKRISHEEAREEKAWAETTFPGGSQAYVGKLGTLLAGYEEERHLERLRQAKRSRPDDFTPEVEY